MAGDHLAGRLVRQDDHVVAGLQIAVARLCVVESLVDDAVLVEDPTSPPGIHRRIPRLVDRDTRLPPSVGQSGDCLLVARRIYRLGQFHVHLIHALYSFHAHHERQRVRRHIVRRLERPSRVLSNVRVALRLEQRLGEPGVRLIERHDIGPRAVLTSVNLER